MAYTKEEAKNGIEKLVEDFKRNKSRLQNQAEAQIENNFIRPLFKFLNWNTTNQGLAVLIRIHRQPHRPRRQASRLYLAA